MTFQEAQARYTAILAPLTPATPAAQVVAAQAALLALLDDIEALPPNAAFDPILDAINAVAPKLNGQVQQEVIDDLKSRSQALAEVTQLLANVSTAAANDASTLSFKTPKLVFAGLTKGLAAARELRDAAKANDLPKVQEKAQAILVLLANLQADAKTV